MEFHTVLVTLPLGELLNKIDEYSEPKDGLWMLCIEMGGMEEISLSMTASLVFYSNDEEDTDFFRWLDEQDLTTLGEVSFVQHIVEVARHQKPHATSEELLASVEYYLDNDTFYDLFHSPIDH